MKVEELIKEMPITDIELHNAFMYAYMFSQHQLSNKHEHFRQRLSHIAGRVVERGDAKAIAYKLAFYGAQSLRNTTQGE